MPEDIKTKWRTWIDEFNKGNVDALSDFFSSDCIVRTSPFPDIKGAEAYKEYHRGIRAAFPDIKLTIDELILEGDTAVLRGPISLTHLGQLPTLPIPPTGKKAVVMACWVAHLAGGKCTELLEYADWLGLLQQLGVIPSM
jgi:predicted ester cyclase